MKLRALLCCLCALVLLAGCGEKSPAALAPGEVYVADHTLYMSPHNSAVWFDAGDPGLRFTLEEDAFAWTMDGEETGKRIENVAWGWQPFPYTDEEWYAMFDEKEPPFFDAPPKNISERYDTLLYQPLSETSFILYLDGSLQLVQLFPCTEDSWCIYSIYSLAPAEK